MQSMTCYQYTKREVKIEGKHLETLTATDKSNFKSTECNNKTLGLSTFQNFFYFMKVTIHRDSLVLSCRESVCNARDPSLIPRSGRSPGEGIGYSLEYSWASLVAQMVKNLLAMKEMWVLTPGWEDPLEEGMTTHSNILSWRIPMDRRAWRATVHRVTKSRTQLSN